MEMPQSLGVRGGRPHRFLGMAVLVVGVLLVVAGGGYSLYGWMASRSLDSLEYDPSTASPSPLAVSGMTLQGLRGKTPSTSSPEVLRDGSAATADPSTRRLYPGEWMAFDAWDDPWAAEPLSSLGEELAEGFLPLGQFSAARTGTLPPATRISIPAIELDAEVRELKILDLGDYRQYETPDRVVGHIPDTANPGEVGNGWLFGHLQSPIKNEGSVFAELPRIPDILRTGRPVYVVLEAPKGSYLYEVYETDVVNEDDFRLYDTEDARVTLVTCVPKWTYDHRLLVTARLVGFRPGT